MENEINNQKAWYKTDEERALADHIIGLEKAALDKWFNGDTSGYDRLWSTRSFSYFDGVVTRRVDDHETIAESLKALDGKLFADHYDFCYPRVQFGINFPFDAPPECYMAIELIPGSLSGIHGTVRYSPPFYPIDKGGRE